MLVGISLSLSYGSMGTDGHHNLYMIFIIYTLCNNSNNTYYDVIFDQHISTLFIRSWQWQGKLKFVLE